MLVACQIGADLKAREASVCQIAKVPAVRVDFSSRLKRAFMNEIVLLREYSAEYDSEITNTCEFHETRDIFCMTREGIKD